MQCNLCDKIFSRRDRIKSHLKSLDFHGVVFASKKRGRPSAYQRPGQSSRASLETLRSPCSADLISVPPNPLTDLLASSVLTASELVSLLLPILREMKDQSLIYESSLARVKESIAYLSGKLDGVINVVSNVKELMEDGVCTKDISLDGINVGLSVLENDVAVVKTSISDLTGMYAVVERNLSVIDKWTLQFEHDQQFVGCDALGGGSVVRLPGMCE